MPTAPGNRCLSENTVVGLVLGEIDEERAGRAREHLDGCDLCRQLVADAARETAPEPPAEIESYPTFPRLASSRSLGLDHQALVAGDTVGRYVVRRTVGEGGMGVVYAAYDPELDREVALKLIRPELALKQREIRLRLKRESQALAKLSHPNVTAVYDIGSVGDEIYVALELVDGLTISDWLKAASRPWRQVVRVFSEAGKGLAAAHAAGLIHRDFKPDNVLLSKDGRVVVTDFGLARLLDDELKPDPIDPDSIADVDSAELTRTGIVVGTPAYMAPEQHCGDAIDARSDQFAFCVALYEAIYSVRPFAGNSHREIARRVLRGEMIERPARPHIPARLYRSIVRGLSRDPDDRFPSMDALLDAIGPRRSKRRYWIASTAAVALAVGTVAGLTLQSDGGTSAASVCGGDPQRVAQVWNDERRAAIASSFRDTAADYAPASLKSSLAALDRYVDDWTASHDRACRATQRGEQSAELLDQRMLCLDGRLRALDSLAEVFERADEQTVERAVAMASELPPVAECDDIERLMGRVLPPADPRLREEVQKVRLSLARVRALILAARYEQAGPAVDMALATARRLGYRPLVAEVLQQKGTLLDLKGENAKAAEALRAAALAAEASRHDQVAAETWSQLAFVVGYKMAEHERGLEYAEQAEAAIERLGGDPQRAGELSAHVGSIHFDMANYSGAKKAFEDAIALLRRAHGGDHLEMTIALDGLANVHRDLGDFDEARRLLERARDMREAALGGDHPTVAGSLDALAGLLFLEGRPGEARPLLLRALDIQIRALGPEHTDVAVTKVLLGMVESDLNRSEAAIEYLRDAVAIQVASNGSEHPEVARTLVNLGAVLGAAKRHDEAEEMVLRALEIARSVYPEEHPDVATYLFYLGDARRRAGHYRQALEPLTDSLDVMERIFEQNHPDIGNVCWSLGEVLRHLRRPEEARAHLERSLQIAESRPNTDPLAVAEARWSLAQVLGATDPRAVELATTALDVFDSQFSDPERAAAVRRFLGR